MARKTKRSNDEMMIEMVDALRMVVAMGRPPIRPVTDAYGVLYREALCYLISSSLDRDDLFEEVNHIIGECFQSCFENIMANVHVLQEQRPIQVIEEATEAASGDRVLN